MDDSAIVELYWKRSPQATAETADKYGNMLKSLSYRLLKDIRDSEECVNDTYLAAWNNMPSDRPTFLGAYLSRITRNISVNRFRRNSSAKRSVGIIDTLTDELAECIPSQSGDVESVFENGRLKDAINRFLLSRPTEKRVIFVRRYFYSDDISDIAKRMDITSAKVKTTLFRLRAELKELLEKEELL